MKKILKGTSIKKNRHIKGKIYNTFNHKDKFFKKCHLGSTVEVHLHFEIT